MSELLPENVNLNVGFYIGTMSGYVITVREFTWESKERGVRGISCPIMIEVFEADGKRYFRFRF